MIAVVVLPALLIGILLYSQIREVVCVGMVMFQFHTVIFSVFLAVLPNLAVFHAHPMAIVSVVVQTFI